MACAFIHKVVLFCFTFKTMLFYQKLYSGAVFLNELYLAMRFTLVFYDELVARAYVLKYQMS